MIEGMDHVLKHVVKKIRALNAPAVAGIGGHGGTGKTTFAKALVSALRRTQEIGFDFFYFPVAQRDKPDSLATYNFDVLRFKIEVLDRFISGDRGFEYRIYNWSQDENDGLINDGSRVRPDTEVLVVEGGVSLHPSLVGNYALKIWFECDYEERLSRAIERDLSYRIPGQTRASITEKWLGEYLPTYQRFIDDCNPRAQADIVIDTSNGNYILTILRLVGASEAKT